MTTHRVRTEILQAQDMATEATQLFEAAQAATALIGQAVTVQRLVTTKADAQAAWLLAKVKTRAAWLAAVDAQATTGPQKELQAALVEAMAQQFEQCADGLAAAKAA